MRNSPNSDFIPMDLYRLYQSKQPLRLDLSKTSVSFSRRYGFTLIELTIVIALLSVIAMFTLPHLKTSQPLKIELAVEQITTALRFTRSEAMRTGIPHGLILDHDNSDASGKDLTVYQLDISGSPFEIDHIIYHPVSKSLYDINIPDSLNRVMVYLQNSLPAFTFENVDPTQHIHFNRFGQPVYYEDGQIHRLTNSQIMVGNNGLLHIISISAVNGRVTVQ